MPKQLIQSIKERSRRYFCYKYNFLSQSNNSYQLLINGKQFYPAMLNGINKAQSSIYIIQYIFESGLTAAKFINALCQASQRGVTVYLILDAFGSSKLEDNDRQQLNTAGIKTFFFNPLRSHHLIKFLYRDHRKLLVIDEQQAFIGGAGICDDYNYPQEQPESWQDIVIKINGGLAQDCAALVKQQLTNNDDINFECETKKNKLHSMQLGLSEGRILTSKSWPHNEIQRAIINAISKANKRIWITTPYFVPSRKLRRKLTAAAHRGCDVRLLLPGEISDHLWVNQIARHSYSRMLKNNINIFEYQKSFTHAKAILCDDWICLGSSNLDRWNQKFNHELNVEIYSAELTSALDCFFESSFSNSMQISPQLWASRSRSQRIKEWFWSNIAMWLERFIHNIR